MTGTAFPPPGRSIPWVGTGFRRPSGTTRFSDFCWAIGPRPQRSRAYRSRGAQQTSLGKVRRRRAHPVATTPAAPADIGLRRREPTHPPRMPYGASLPFGTVAHLRLPPDAPSRVPSRPVPGGSLAPVLRGGALAPSVPGSLRQGPGSGLAYMAHLRSPDHASRTHRGRPRAGAELPQASPPPTAARARLRRLAAVLPPVLTARGASPRGLVPPDARGSDEVGASRRTQVSAGAEPQGRHTARRAPWSVAPELVKAKRRREKAYSSANGP